MNQIGKVTVADIEKRIKQKQKSYPDGHMETTETPINQSGEPTTPHPIQVVHNRNNNSSSNSNISPPGKLIHQYTTSISNSVSSIVMSSDAQRVYAGGKGCINLLSSNASKPAEKIVFTENAFVRSCKISKNESTLIACGECSGIHIFDIDSQQKKQVIATQDSNICYNLICRDDTVFTSLANGSIGMWDLRSPNQPVRTFEGHNAPCSVLEFDPLNSKSLFSGSLDKSVKMWDVNTGSIIQEYNTDSRVLTMAASPITDALVLGLENGSLETLQNTKAKFRQGSILYKHADSVLTTKFSPKGNYFISGGKDCLLSVNRVSPPATREMPSEKHCNSILCSDIVSLPDHDVIVVGSWDHKAYIYNLKLLS